VALENAVSERRISRKIDFPFAPIPKSYVPPCGVKYIPLQQASRHSMASQIMAEHKRKAIEEIQNKLGHFNKQTQKTYIVE